MTTYFVLTTASVDQTHYDNALELSSTCRKNNDETKTILETYNFDASDTEGAFYGDTPYTYEEILSEITNAEWQ